MHEEDELRFKGGVSQRAHLGLGMTSGLSTGPGPRGPRLGSVLLLALCWVQSRLMEQMASPSLESSTLIKNTSSSLKHQPLSGCEVPSGN